jgi:diaminopimelate decarboxylase
MLFNKRVILNKAKEYNSFYLYDENIILEYTQRLKNNFPQVQFLYSIKSNSHKHVVKTVFSQGFGADAASLGEVQISSEHGLSKEEIYYSAPGKN